MTDDRYAPGAAQAPMESAVSEYYLDSEYTPPQGGFPQANPDGTRTTEAVRAHCVPSADAAREMGAYSEQDYGGSVLQSRRQHRAPALRRGRTQKVGGSYGNARPKPEPSDAERFDAFEDNG